MRRDTVLAWSSVGLIGTAMFAVVQSGTPEGMSHWQTGLCIAVDVLCGYGIGWGGGKDGGASPPEGPTP